MKIALVTLNASTDVHQWSGLNYFIARSLERAGAEVRRVGPGEAKWSMAMKLRQRWHDARGQTYPAVIEPDALDAMGEQVRRALPSDADVVLSVTSLMAAAVGPMRIPHVSWDDATNAAMDQYYPDFLRMAEVSRRHSAELGRRAVDAVDLAIYASEWAADAARGAYDLAPEHVAVVPFGANLETMPADADVERSIASRGQEVCRLLWIGVDWTRKGGPLALEIARALRDRGLIVELTLVGCEPEGMAAIPEWVRVEGFISKGNDEGRERLAGLFSRSHFFVMPSHAEAYGLVHAEASAFGVPSVAIRTGGVPTVILDGETGLLFEPGTSADRYAERILTLHHDQAAYIAMAKAARHRAVTRLNWDVAARDVLRLVGELR